MKLRISSILMTALMLGGIAFADETPAPEKAGEPQAPQAPPAFEGETKKVGSYFMGYQAGYSLTRLLIQQGMSGMTVDDLDEATLIQGLKDSINAVEPTMDMKESMAAIQALQAKLAKRTQELVEANQKAGDAYRASRADEEGMVTTESGLMYKELKAGDGESYQAPPEGQMDMSTRFQVRYSGKLIDGTEFDATDEEPRIFDFRVVPGFEEALRLMPTGATWELIMKPELGYGEQGSPPLIQPGSTLVFELSLEKILKPEPPKPRGEAVTPPIPVPPAPKK